jgi:hypothetical protein
MPTGQQAHRSTHVADTPEMALTDALNHVTPSSIAAARAAQRRERAECFKATGIRVGQDGRPILSHRLVRRDGRHGVGQS